MLKKFRLLLPILMLVILILACESGEDASNLDASDPTVTATKKLGEPSQTKPSKWIYVSTAD